MFFWIGKTEHRRKQPSPALRPLKLAIALARGAEFEAEARWLLADVYRQLGHAKAYEATLGSLAHSGISGPFRQKAIDALSADTK